MDSQAALQERLNNAKRIPLTNEENMILAHNSSAIGWVIAKVSERTGIPLSSGRVAHAPALKCLLVVD
jgi:hypothetical protein